MDQVLIFSLFGNSLFNAVFTTLTTIVVATLLHGMETHILLPLTTVFIAFVIIIFSEAIPKIIASKSPQTTLKWVAPLLYYVFLVSKPVIWLLDRIVHCITIFLKVSTTDSTSAAELKAIIADKNSPFKDKHRSILLNSIDLEEITIKEVLIPLRMVEAVDISGDISILKKRIYTTHHTQIIVYDGTIDNIVGYIHVKDVLHLDQDEFELNEVQQILRPILFVNDFVPVIRQIHRAQKYRKRIFVVINEYGDTLGIACLEDMFEMIVGDFTTESPQQNYQVVKNQENQLIVYGTMLIRELNELYHLGINPDTDTLTVNGLVLKQLNGIPNIGVCFRINNLVFEVINVGHYWVERVKIIFI